MKKQWFAPQIAEISVRMTEQDPIYSKGGGGTDNGFPEQQNAPGHFDPCTNCICTS